MLSNVQHVAVGRIEHNGQLQHVERPVDVAATTGLRVTLINDEDEGGEREGHDRMDVLELMRTEEPDADLDFLGEGSGC